MMTDDDRLRNRCVAWHPALRPDQLPAVRIDQHLIFIYFEDGTLRVTVDTEDVEEPTSVQINVNNGTVWSGTPGGE